MTRETTERFHRMADAGLQQMRELTELNLRTWNEVVERQMALIDTAWQSGLAQSEKMTEQADPAGRIQQQMEFSREMGQALFEQGRDNALRGIEIGQEYGRLAETGMRRITEALGGAPGEPEES